MDFFLGLLSQVLGIRLGEAWVRPRLARRALARLESSGTVDSGLRVISGRVGGLTHEWMHGPWVVAPGQLRLFRTVVRVAAIEDGFREPSFREHWGVVEDAHIVVLECATGRVEWALLAGCHEAAVARLRG